LHGAEDPNYPVEFGHVIDGLKAAKTPFEVELYSGTAHGFSQPKNKAEERAITQAKATTGRTFNILHLVAWHALRLSPQHGRAHDGGAIWRWPIATMGREPSRSSREYSDAQAC
jgi:Dienelactone hydrolase family